MTVELKTPLRKPLRLGYLDPATGLRSFVNDGQGKRMYGLSGQAFLRAVVERESEKKNDLPLTPAEERRRKRYGSHYLDSEVTTPDGRSVTRAQRFLERVDANADIAIAKTYGISTAQAGGFYEKRLEQANELVLKHIYTLFPDLIDNVGLTNDVTLVTPHPSDILSHFVDNPQDKHLHFETQRQMVLAELSAELSERSRTYNLKRLVKDVQRYLTRNLFSGVDFHQVYGVYDDMTNRVVDLYSNTPPKEVPEGHFVAGIEKRMRTIPITEPVVDAQGQEKEEIIGTETALCDVRIKLPPSAMRKALRRAVLRERRGEGDYIDVYEDVSDPVGLMLVVKGASDSHSSPEVNRVVNQVKKIVRKGRGDAQFVPDFETNNDGSQAEKQRYQRYQVYIEDSPIPFEMIFYSQKDYQNSQDEIGERQEKDNQVRYTGRAHDLYKMVQSLDIHNHLFPSSLQFYNGKRDLRKKAIQHMDEVAEQVKQRVQRRRIL